MTYTWFVRGQVTVTHDCVTGILKYTARSDMDYVNPCRQEETLKAFSSYARMSIRWSWSDDVISVHRLVSVDCAGSCSSSDDVIPRSEFIIQLTLVDGNFRAVEIDAEPRTICRLENLKPFNFGAFLCPVSGQQVCHGCNEAPNEGVMIPPFRV